jgi:hypothetical protein
LRYPWRKGDLYLHIEADEVDNNPSCGHAKRAGGVPPDGRAHGARGGLPASTLLVVGQHPDPRLRVGVGSGLPTLTRWGPAVVGLHGKGALAAEGGSGEKIVVLGLQTSCFAILPFLTSSS